MYEYIGEHSSVLPYAKREVHFFERLYNQSLRDTEIQKHRKDYIHYFPVAELRKNHSLITGESSPTYLLHS